MESLNNSQHEAICNQCGECCRIKLMTQDKQAFPTAEFCPCLDLETKLCRVYSHRFEVLPMIDNENCMTITDAVRFGLVPPTCAYVPDRFPSMQYDEKAHRKNVSWADRLRLKTRIEQARKKLKKILKTHPEWEEGFTGRAGSCPSQTQST